MISIDYETFLISDDAIFPKPVCMSAYAGTDQGTFLFKRELAEDFLSEYLGKELIVAHNAVFECGVTIKHFPDLANQVFDALDDELIYCTKINEELWDVQRKASIGKKDLASLVKHYFKEDISATKGEDAWRLRYSELDNIPIRDWPKEAVNYAIDDSIWAYRIKEKQTPINQSLALKSAVYLNLMASEGFRIDQNRVEKLESEIWEFLTPRYDFLVSEGFCDYIMHQKQPRKQVKKLKEYVESLEIDLQRTDKGGVATSAEALASYLTQKEDPILRAYFELSKYEKILTTYIKNLKKGPKVYTQYSTVKKSGRTSSSGSSLYTSVNMQNMPREVPDVTYDIRNCFIPRTGFKVCSIDYSGLELCSVAHQLYTLLGYSKMRDMLNEGDKPVDIHSKLAARVKGISYEDFMTHKSEYKDYRQKVKPVNLGLPGGMGYDTIRYQMWKDGIKTQYAVLGTSRNKQDLYTYLFKHPDQNFRIRRVNKYEYALVQDEIVALKRHVFNAYPELEEFLKETHKRFLTGEFKWKKNDFGEWEKDEMYMYDTHGFKRDWCTYTALCNGFLMQTPSATGAQKAVNKLMRTFYDNPDIFLQAFIHDEVVFEIRENRFDLVDQAANIMVEEMQQTLTSVRIAAEASMSDYWQKADGFWTRSYWK